MNALLILLLIATSCKKTEAPTDQTPTTTTNSLESIMNKFTGVQDIYIDGDYLVIETNDIPDHGSPYFSSNDPQYEPYNGSNPAFHLNPNHIAEQNIIFRIPLKPQEADNKEATPLGPIGVAVNGVVIFNQYAAGNSPLTFEINSFDQYNGHPQQSGVYHYHIEPTYLTQNLSKDALLGVLLDGFPVYGPMENGQLITDDDLDEYHGHFKATAEFPNGIYHYHITADAPYINGNGFFGNAGYVSQ